MLRITCDSCSKSYSIPLDKLRKAVHHATCTRCGHKILVRRPAEAAPPSSGPAGDSDLRASLASVTDVSPSAAPPPREATPPRGTSREGMVLVPALTLSSVHEPAPLAVAAFYLDEHPVTHAQYQRFVEATDARPPVSWVGRRPAAQLASHPVVDVSFEEAVAYARWCRKRLPTDLEWQVAARGPDHRAFPWGDAWDPERCAGRHSGLSGTVSVTSHEEGVSHCGCWHLVGNVWEWTELDPRSRAPEQGYRWVFGGSFCHPCQADGAIPRNAVAVGNAYRYLGFRCAADR